MRTFKVTYIIRQGCLRPYGYEGQMTITLTLFFKAKTTKSLLQRVIKFTNKYGFSPASIEEMPSLSLQ